MPIKFRCNYCRQFLGISRAQAGGIVDCPTCGRSIRVPQLDGSQQPVPQPELNLQDAHLARALEELARLGSADSQLGASQAEGADDPEEAENEIPQPILEPIPIEVPIPPTPIAITTPDPTEEPPQTAVAPVSALTADLLSELATLSPAPASPAAAVTSDASAARPRDTQRSTRSSLAASGVLLCLAFLLGMLVERFVRVLESKTPSDSPAAREEPAVAAVSQLTGRITYKSADGTSQPDRGARVVAFPMERRGDVRLSVQGLRPADSDADARVASAGLSALGGGLATANDAGQFELTIPAGTYQLLILSHFKARDPQQVTPPELSRLLEMYFDKPDDLLGQMQFEFGPLRIKGTGDVRDQSF